MRRPSFASLLVLLAMSTAVACSAGSQSGDEGKVPDGGGDETANADAGDDTSPPSDGESDGGSDGSSEDTIPPYDGSPPPEAGDGGIIPGCGLDSDGDGITDAIEGRGKAGGDTDTDGDGIPDWQDLDSDNDGIPDIVEWVKPGCATPMDEMNDVDGDGIPNFQDTDSDGNGLPDKDEACPPAAVLAKLGFPACVAGAPYDFDGDGVPDYLDFDNDHDSSSSDKTLGLKDSIELADNSGKYVGLSLDTDGDGIPDLYDRDSDGDYILDLDDGTTDPDGDGKPAFRDDDSDGDGVADLCEARGKALPTSADLSLPVKDSDGDGSPDFLDKDSDDDLLPDGAEDKDNDCTVDANETDRTKADTDGDGVSDLVEVTLLGPSAAKDASSTPAKSGKFYFLVPYSVDGSAKPTPTSSLLALSTKLNKGDLAFIVDTTGSMGGTISGLKSSLSTTIIPALKAKIPDLGIGVAAHDDFPYSSYGSASWGDRPFYFPRIPEGYVTTTTSASQTAANALTTHGGSDLPESNVQAMYKALTGVALTWPGGTLPADSPPSGTFGAMRFRSDALPIVMNLTDVPSHNGKRALDKNGVSYSTSYEFTYSFSTYNIDQLVAKFNELGAKFLGGAADNGSRDVSSIYSPYAFLSYVADKTGSLAPPSAFGTGSTTCKTGVSGAAVAPDGPTIGGVKQCRLVFSFNLSGGGLSTSVVDGVSALLASIKFDTYVEAYNGAGEPIDVVTSFMDKVEPQPSGGTDPMTGTACVTFPSSQLADLRRTPKALPGPGDIAETIRQVNPGSFYCFAVVPKPNTTVKPSPTAQLYRAWLKVLAVKPAGGTFTLGSDREVLFIVPPVLN